MSSLKTYVICGSEKESIVSHIISRGISKDSITCIDKNNDSVGPDKIFNVYDPYLDRGTIPRLSLQNLALEEIFLVMKYYSAFSHANEALTEDMSAVLIMESDVILHKEFLRNAEKILEDETWDCVRLIQPETEQSLPPSGALLFRMKFIKKIVKTFLPFRESIDSELYFQSVLHRASVLICSPSLAYSKS